MAKKAKKLQTDKGLALKIVNPDAAGIDVADTEMQVCVPSTHCESEPNRRFGTFTRDLGKLVAWLKSCGIKTVAMEATGVYWISLFFKLQEAGIEAILCNAREIKNISGKKTDKSDAEWIMLLHQYGLLKASFQPENKARQIRNLSRHRSSLIRTSSREILHMQKAMQQMNIKLGNVLSDITGASGLRILKMIIDGERDPYKLAALADKNCKSSREEIALSLEGTWEEDHLFELKQAYDLYHYLMGMVNECDSQIERLMNEFVSPIDKERMKQLRSKKKKNKKNKVNFDAESYACALWGVNPMCLPGMSYSSLVQLMGELGSDFTEKFDSSKKFCSWCNLVPNNKISGGKLLSSRVPKRKNPVGQIFRLCAMSLTKAKNPLGNYYRRIRAKSGGRQAIVATANKLAEIFYTMVKNKSPYDESRVGEDEKAIIEKRIAICQRQLAALNRKHCELVS